ncbi:MULTISPECIES: ATP-binding protein [Streptomyces]|uniref:ATP-binding protein n=1 Tax=Streptomyces TaxID=1883 RepID=UPI002108D0EE|nr:ATP-binding protein [Streptomyces longispororuber]MCQ4213219.1 ATP-binding protein [Streptomyces longispororuber]
MAESLNRPQGPLRPLPAVVVLGGRGSGKSTLTAHLRTWAERIPLAALDLEPISERGGTRIDVLTELAFQLSAHHDELPQLSFPALGSLLAAVGTAVDARSRERAVREMAEALRQGRAREHSYEELLGIADTAAQAAGLPGWASAVVPLVQGGLRSWRGLRLRRRFAETSAAGPGRGATADFLVGVNRLYHGYPAQREEAERVLLDAFLADLRGAYASAHADRKRTTNCLALLDNADSTVGEAFLHLLLDSRERSGRPDPLLVVATARRRPEALVRAETGSGRRPDYRESWPQQGEFVPLAAGPLRAGRLRDLNRREVEEQAAAAVDALPVGSVLPKADNAVQWLGWIVYEITRGHPAGTAQVLEVLRRMPADLPWDQRVRQCLAPVDGSVRPAPVLTAAPALTEWLLRDCSAQLARVLPRAAAPLTLGRAETCDALWEGQESVLREFVNLSADDLRSVSEPDEGLPALPRLSRFLLLRLLDGAPGSPDHAGTWTGAHRALRAAARARGDLRAAAYHDLALGELPAAVDYLRERFDEVGADTWCADLAWIQRAPARWHGALPEPARDRYERLVGVAEGDATRQAVTRLLTAGWITAHPRADGAPLPYADPLGDPYAELYPDIAEEFLTLRRPIGNEHDRHVLLRMAQRYERKPWW